MKSFRRRTASSTRSLVSVCALVGALTAPAMAQKVCFVATLDGAQEVPANASPAKGTGFVVMDRAANTITYDLIYTGLSAPESAAHVHGFAAPGASAGVRFGLPLGDVKSGTVTYPEADEASYLAGLAYFNVHTSAFPGGEIRGQLVRSASAYTYVARADGVQEVPGNASPARGLGWFRFNLVANSIDYSFTRTPFVGSETAAHIHGFAAPGVSAGVKIGLAAGPHKSGTLAYLNADEANYIAGLSYINVHSSSFPGGEIRGQVIAGCTNPTTFCTAKTNSQGCVPTIGSTGTPQLSGPDNLHITATNLINNKAGVMYWGLAPRVTPVAFVGGLNCIQAPTIRTPIQNSGGNAPPDDCSGVFDFFFSQPYMASRGLVAGSQAYCQYWYRDSAHPDGTAAGLTDAICFELIP